jgi:hypothetical protein
VWRVGFLLVLSLALAGCGGGSSSSGSTTTPPPTTPPPTTPPPTNPPPSGGGNGTTPTVVAVGQGQTASGVDIAVVAPASSTAPNAQNLGVNDPTAAQASASNTGGVIHQGTTGRVVMFGPGLSSATTVTISGPSDITVTDVRSITATDNTPGVSFMATAASNAALGARTVYLQKTNNDITAFTGGMEVVP